MEFSNAPRKPIPISSERRETRQQLPVEVATTLIPPVKTRQQIADEFGVSTKTLKNWLKKLDVSLPSCSLTPRFQKICFLCEMPVLCTKWEQCV
jgi:hypothetical protein